MIEISGLSEFQKELETAIEAFESLNGEFAAITFDADDPSSVEAAITEAERAIEAKLHPFRGNEMVEALAADLMSNIRQHIYERADELRAGEQEHQPTMTSNDILRDIENTVTDLRAADYNSFDHQIQRLSRLIHARELEPVTSKLTEGIDLEAWLEEGYLTQGSMIGSAKLSWPKEPEKDLGTKILLIDHFALNERAALKFAHTFYEGGSRFTDILQSMARQMIVPFSRDFIQFAKRALPAHTPSTTRNQIDLNSRKIFIVHGHDEGTRETVARFLEALDFKPIILHEQPNKGRTIITKFREEAANVGFAVVLMTPDDHGGKQSSDTRPRARQNVVFELGFFIGALGPERVAALMKGEVERPSDFDGVVYISLDHGHWKIDLAKELKAVGFEVDFNRVVSG